MKFGLICLALLLFGVVAPVEAQKKKKMKTYISSDMEGVVGAVTAEQLSPTGFVNINASGNL